MVNETRKMRSLVVPRVKLEKPGDFAEGFFMGTADVQGKKGLYKEATLQKEGSRDAVTVSLGVVAAKAFALIAEGEFVRITFTGTVKSGAGNNVNEYKIEVAESEENA